MTSSRNPTERTSLTASENVRSLFQPDTLALGQFFDDRRNNKLIEPEVKLMLAVLADAIQCFQDNFLARHDTRRRLFDDVQRWIFEVREDWVFSFENICVILGINPQYVRKGLARWREEALAKRRTGRSIEK
jgi:hypothetical protein